MHRTQIYLTDEEVKSLRAIAQRRGTTQSDLIRTAVDRFIKRENGDDRAALLVNARGLWRDRQDLPDLEMLRQELDRTRSVADEP